KRFDPASFSIIGTSRNNVHVCPPFRLAFFQIKRYPPPGGTSQLKNELGSCESDANNCRIIPPCVMIATLVYVFSHNILVISLQPFSTRFSKSFIDSP